MGPWDPAPPAPEAPQPEPKRRGFRARRLLLIVALVVGALRAHQRQLRLDVLVVEGQRLADALEGAHVAAHGHHAARLVVAQHNAGGASASLALHLAE